MKWLKPIVPPKPNNDEQFDNTLKFTDNLTVYWEVQIRDQRRRGSFEGFYLDDPMNPVLSGAMGLAAGVASSAALVFATLA